MQSHPRRTAAFGAVVLLTALAACSSAGSGDTPTATPTGSSSASSSGSSATPTPVSPRVSGTIATDLLVPWGLAFLPDGSALVSQRDEGTIVRVSDDGTVLPVGRVPGVVAGGEGGLLGLALSPTYAKDKYVYAYLTTATDNRVVRMTYDGGALGAPQVVVSGLD